MWFGPTWSMELYRQTPAGRQREMVRAGVVSIPVTFSVSAKWLKILTEFKQQKKITVVYLRKINSVLRGYRINGI